MATSDTPHYALDEHVTDPALVTSEVVRVNIKEADSGNVKLTFDSVATGNIAYNATAATVKAALVATSPFDEDDITVETETVGGAKYWILTFAGRYAGENVGAVTAEGVSLKDGEASVTPEVTVLTAGGAATKARRRGTGDADATNRTNPLAGKTPAEQRAAAGSDYGDS